MALDASDYIVGWGATRESKLGSLLTDLFVDPDHHGQGIGQAILRDLWPAQALHDKRCTFSSRHPHALPLYVRAGLTPRWPLLYLEGPPPRADHAAIKAFPVSADAAAQLESELSGEHRGADYRFWTRSPNSCGVLVSEGERVLAVGAIRPGEVLHLACRWQKDASAALKAALAATGPGPTRLCVPGPHPALGDLFKSGFRLVEYDFAMTTADLDLPPHWIYSPGLG